VPESVIGDALFGTDIRSSQYRYGERLRELGMSDVTHEALGWRFWYGGPWAAASLVSARKPS